MKQSSATKAANVMKRRAAKLEGNRKLAAAINDSLFAHSGKRPEKGKVIEIVRNITAGGTAGGSPKFTSYAEASGGKRQEDPAQSEVKSIPELNKTVKGLRGEVEVVEVKEQGIGKEEFSERLKEMEERMLAAMSTGLKRSGEELEKKEMKKGKTNRMPELVKEKKKGKREVIAEAESNSEESESGGTTATEESSTSSLESGTGSEAEEERERKGVKKQKVGTKSSREDTDKTMEKGSVIRERAKRVVSWAREEEGATPSATPGSNQAIIARDKKLLADSSEVFKIIGGVLVNLQKIKRTLNKKEGKEMMKLGKEMDKLAKMSVTGMNYIEIQVQEVYGKSELFNGDASLLLRFRDAVSRNLGRLNYDRKVVKIPESRELEKAMITARAVMRETMKSQGNGYNLMTPPNSPQVINKYSPGTGVRSPDARSCFNCNQTGHIAARCAAPCGGCKQVGHQKRDCPKK